MSIHVYTDEYLRNLHYRSLSLRRQMSKVVSRLIPTVVRIHHILTYTEYCTDDQETERMDGEGMWRGEGSDVSGIPIQII